MSLSSLYLDAFTEVARQKSFSAAAKKLNLTQSALSQRVLNLESDLGSTLFIRESSGLRLTDLGSRLLRYCHSRESLESEFLSTTKTSNALAGILKVRAYSTIARSIVLPALSKLIKKNPDIVLDFAAAELRDLPSLLTSGQADFIFLDKTIEKQGIALVTLGHEEYVMVHTKASPKDVYLDHDEDDSTTYDFLKFNGQKSKSLSRHFLGEIDSILEGVRLGIGRAVVPKHLIASARGLEIVPGLKAMKVPVYLAYYEQAFYTELQKAALNLLIEETKSALKN